MAVSFLGDIMKLTLHCQHPGEIKKLSEEVHDLYFEVDDLKISDDRRILIKLYRHPAEEVGILAISEVNALEITDTEKVGFYDIVDLEYNKKTQVLSFSTGIPIRVSIALNRVEIYLELDKPEYRE